MAGYSGKPLADKLGMKAGMNMAIVNAPDNYDSLIDEWPVGASVSRSLNEPDFDLIHYFATSQKQLQSDIGQLKSQIVPKGIIWLSWPKAGSAIQSDVSENDVRRIGLAAGLVDVKVCAVDDDWSALKFVYRLKDRP